MFQVGVSTHSVAWRSQNGGLTAGNQLLVVEKLRMVVDDDMKW